MHAVEDKSCDVSMFIQGVGEDQDVVKVDRDHYLCDEVLEYLVDHNLKGGWAIGETKVL
jgi:hypothetical protein